MALTIANVKKNVDGATREAILDITFDSSYPTGGESFVVSDVDPSQATGMAFDFVSASTAKVPAGNLVWYDYTNKKLMAFVITTGVEVADTTSLATLVVRVLVKWGQVNAG